MWGKRESLTANDNDLISVSLKIIRAPSFGRGRRAKRGGVGIPVSEIPLREPTSAPSGHLLPKEGGRKEECVDW